jgi:peptide/nickel transport system permease protein
MADTRGAVHNSNRIFFAPGAYSLVGGGMVLAVLALAIVGFFWTFYEPNAVDFIHRFAPPRADHLLGTDGYGRDILSRVMASAWKSVSFGLGSTAVALAGSIPFALAAVYWPRRVATIIMVVTDALVAIPLLVFSLLVIVAIGVGHTQSIFAVGLGAAPRFLRVILGAALDAATQEYVAAARARGETALYIQYREILPNILSPIIVEASLFIGLAIMAGGALSYLGLGTQPPDADWGVMIHDGQRTIEKTWWPLLAPSLAMLLAIVGFNFLGEGLRDDL